LNKPLQATAKCLYIGNRNFFWNGSFFSAQGISRSASILIAYLMKSRAESIDVIHAQIKAIRPIIRPNPGFRQRLLDFESQVVREEKKG
jgi:hypothetical protein